MCGYITEADSSVQGNIHQIIMLGVIHECSRFLVPLLSLW